MSETNLTKNQRLSKVLWKDNQFLLPDKSNTWLFQSKITSPSDFDRTRLNWSVLVWFFLYSHSNNSQSKLCIQYIHWFDWKIYSVRVQDSYIESFMAVTYLVSHVLFFISLLFNPVLLTYILYIYPSKISSWPKHNWLNYNTKETSEYIFIYQ